MFNVIRIRPNATVRTLITGVDIQTARDAVARYLTRFVLVSYGEAEILSLMLTPGMALRHEGYTFLVVPAS